MSLKIFPEPDDHHEPTPLRRNQFSLRAVFVGSTVLGIALAGFARVGFEGAIGMLFGVWITSLGLFLLWSGFRSSNQRPITLLGGTATTILGLMFVGGIATTNASRFRRIAWPIVDFSPFVILLVGIVCYVVWDVLRVKWQISFDVTAQGISNAHGVPEKKLAVLQEFFRKTNFERSTKLTVRANRNKNGYLTIKCYGDFQRAEQQRIRNFLSDIL